MEEEKYVSASSMRYSARIMSPEIVEIGDDSKSITNSIDGISNDVYVAVGKNDTDVLKWALDHAVSPGARVFLVHVFPPLTYISTPGKPLYSTSDRIHYQVAHVVRLIEFRGMNSWLL